jgi:hypothetical protein
MEFEVKENKKIEEGVQNGKLSKVVYRHVKSPKGNFEYVDVMVTLDVAENFALPYGCPANVTTESKLGKLLERFGFVLKAGQKVKPEEILLGSSDLKHSVENGDDVYELNNPTLAPRVRCVVMHESYKKDGEQKEAARLVEGSLKPIVTNNTNLPSEPKQ